MMNSKRGAQRALTTGPASGSKPQLRFRVKLNQRDRVRLDKAFEKSDQAISENHLVRLAVQIGFAYIERIKFDIVGAILDRSPGKEVQ